MNKRIILWLAIGMAALAVVGLGVYGVVRAQTPSPTATPWAGMFGRGGMHGGMDSSDSMGRAMPFDKTSRMDFFGKFGGLKNYALDIFAEKLGLSADEVTSRVKAGETFAQIAESKGISAEQLPDFMQQVCTAAIDQAVTDGKLTQEQADALKTRLQDMDWSRMLDGQKMRTAPQSRPESFERMPMRGDLALRGSWMHDALLEAFAARLNLTVEDVTARLEAGETHTQIAESKGVSGDAYTALWKEIHIQVIDQAVTDGKLTQEQADAIKTRIESSTTPMWGGMFSKGERMPGGRRGR